MSSILQKNKWKIVCKTDQLHFRILWIVLRSFFGKTNFKLEISYLYHALPNAFWKLQSWGCFNAGLVCCARAICQSMYQIAINMSRYKYIQTFPIYSSYHSFVDVVTFSANQKSVKTSKIAIFQVQMQSKNWCNNQIRSKNIFGHWFFAILSLFWGSFNLGVSGKTCPKNNEKMFSQQVALRP